jgi:hypothetical protein
MQGIKDKKDKLVYDLDFDFLTGMAQRMQLNRNKYPVGNWKNKIDIEDLKQAMFRHMIEIMRGNYSDEQEYGHFYAVACNSFMLLKQIKNESNKLLQIQE